MEVEETFCIYTSKTEGEFEQRAKKGVTKNGEGMF